MTQEEYCDGCGRGCLLSNPMCQLGMNIARERAQRADGANAVAGGEGGGHRGHGGSRGGHGPHGGLHGGKPGEGDEFLVRSFHHCAHLLMHRRAKEGGRAGVLMILSRHGFMAQSMLAEKLDIRSASMSELLGKMEQAGLVTRTQNESDKRAVWVELTDEGRAEAERAAAQREEDNRNLFAVLTDEEKSQLAVILDKLAHSWHEQFDEEDRPQRGGRGGAGNARG